MAQTSNAGSAQQSAFQRVMLAVDESEASLRAAEYTKAIFAGRAQIRLVTVAQNPRTLFPLGATTQGFLAAAREEIVGDARAVLEKVEAMFAGTELEFGLVDLSLHRGNTADALLATASHWNADLLVMGMRHHHGLLRWIEGTVSEPVARRATCALLLVPEDCRVPTDRPPARMVFALDGSACSFAGLRTGLQLASPDALLRTVYVMDRAVHLFDDGAAEMLESAYLEQGCTALERATRICADHGRVTETAMIKTQKTHDDVPHAIVRDTAEWNGDLLVLGTHGRRGLARWLLGSVAARTARLVDTPVLLARSAEAAAE
ncbi:Universal stress protein family [Paraburkholderia caribensis MBA4]|uniref:Universal stress protein family n=1 Tax=Paraburkholderia caribensis MBA4 TaxID=1323664 RepID=A0A0P0RG75_9BURK|nr:universal stress protein [Paraburkholderia caribensis]ALL67464.1 Universal stress protein family [Paraburkholderia caribensis MBA4]